MDRICISLIVPVYGASRYMSSCVTSLLAQTMDEIEVLFVDDCDPEESLGIARRMLAGYQGSKQFRYLRTPVNGGPGAARNLGLSEAVGEYVAFIDCDDVLEPDYCRSLYQAAVAHQADIACCDAYAGDYNSPAGRVLCGPSFEAGELFPAVRKRILRSFVTYLWTYLFRRKFLLENEIRFPDEHSSEDTCFVTCAWLTAQRGVHICEPLYHYIIRDTSVSKRHDRGRARSRIASMRRMKAYARNRGLYRAFGPEIRLLMFKKGWLNALRDILFNL